MRIGVLGVVVGVLLGLVVVVAPAGAAEPPPAAPVRHVTLITGDRVAVAGRDVVAVEPAPRAEPFGYHRHVDRDGDLHVVPDDAAPLVGDGRLDPRLFNVSELLRSGYDDAARADVPLVVSGPGPAAGAAVPKDRSGRAFRDLVGPSARSGGRIWLDGPVRALLDRTVPATGAPRAWAAGLTGRGVKVAVLDTGYDAAHPDLAGRVVAARDFTDSGGPADDHGHGTHVAATIAGSGAASGGRLRGVAPEASLLVGKVLDRTGRGRESQLIAGLRWAAEQGSDVVNVSIGGYETDGTDPLSQAVDELTRQHGTLFVVAAGNRGPRDRTVTTPAVAAEALAVAAVDDAGAVADFSSRGPVLVSGAAKPDLAAPGVDVVAARAAGTSMGQPLDALHTQSSGTSMAAPHVAGGAALLAQRHPDWPAGRLKAALMGSADPTADTPVTAQGAGRLDLARAAATTVTADRGDVGFGDVPAGTTAVQPVTYRNTGPAPVVLRLRTDLGTVAPDTLVVPAHGTATASVSVRADQPGPRSGRLVAEGGAARVQTVLWAHTPHPVHALTVRVVDEGGPVPARVALTNLDTGEHGLAPTDQAITVDRGRYALVVGGMAQRGRFLIGRPEVAVQGDAEVVVDVRATRPLAVEFDQPVAEHGTWSVGMGVGPLPNLPSGATAVALGEVGAPMHLEIGPGEAAHFRYVYGEARFERPLTLTIAGQEVAAWPVMGGPWPADPDARADAVLDGEQVDVRGKVVVLSVPAEELLPRLESLARAGAVMAVHAGPLRGLDPERAALPLAFADASVVDLVRGGPAPATAKWVAASPRQHFAAFRGTRSQDHRVRVADMAEVRTRVHAEGERQVVYPSAGAAWDEGALTLSGGPVRGAAEQVVHYTAGRWASAHDLGGAIPPLVELAAGERTTHDVLRAVFGPVLRGEHLQADREGDAMVLRVPLLADTRGQWVRVYDRDVSRHTTVHRDGNPVTGTDAEIVEFAGVPEPARYRVESRVRHGGALSTDVRAVWDFPSRRGESRLPLLVVRFAPEVDLSNRATGGALRVPFVVQRVEGAPRWPLSGVTAEVSYDDGVTWAAAPVRAGHVLLDAPRGGFVSLRVKARDVRGASVEQTVVRAFGLR